ncbi:putative integral membrane protein (TIGR00698 family) [Nocardia sp. GAS34]|uniref:YeiH family protein n=1 Tax=unclassified Nocardia TaxID=2637762 RepID=UPI003D2602FE
MSRIADAVQVTSEETTRRGRTALLARRVPGFALAVLIAVVAMVIGRLIPVVGAPVTGVVIGAAVAAIRAPGRMLQPGIELASKMVLQLAVVTLGTQLSLAQVVHTGFASLPVMVGTLAACLVAAYFVGRWLGVVGDLRTLVGVGTGICGASAIAAVTPVIGAVGADVAYAVSTIFLFNIAAVLSFPALGHLLGLGQHAFGLLAGTAVNDMSSVVAAASTYGGVAANYAVVVKLTRTLFIIPICLGLAAWVARRRSRSGADAPARRTRIIRLVPWFLVAFLAAAALNSAGLLGAGVRHGMVGASMWLITIALSAIGLSTDVRGLRTAGARPLVLGAVLWGVVTLTSLGMQYLFMGSMHS